MLKNIKLPPTYKYLYYKIKGVKTWDYWANGISLDSENANYSYGSLQRIF
jgi:hypothetical protein